MLHKRENKFEQVNEDYKSNKKMNADGNMVFMQHLAPKGLEIDSHFHNWIEFTYVVEGQQKIVIDNQVYNLSTGDFIYIPSGLMHSSQSMLDTKKMTFMIHDSYIDTIVNRSILEQIKCNTTLIESAEEYYKYKQLINCFLEICHCFESNELEERLKFTSNFYGFFYMLIKYFKVDTEKNNVRKLSHHHNLILQINSYIYKYYDTNLKLNEVAKQFNVSPQYISKLYKNLEGITFLDALNDIRISHASYEIVNTNKNITEICYDCGFGNIKSFISCFKKKYNMTPKQYQLLYNPKKAKTKD